MNLAELHHISKRFGSHVVLDDFSCNIGEQEFLVITGASGAGKSTLLNLIGLLDKPDSGEIVLFGRKNIKPNSRQSRQILAEDISYMFQNFALLEDCTVRENLQIVQEHPKTALSKSKLKDALHYVGLDGYEDNIVASCSGGEQQRIALARVFLKPGKLILADEPTGSLDEANKKIVIDLLKKLQNMGKSIVIVSHDEAVVQAGQRVIRL